MPELYSQIGVSAVPVQVAAISSAIPVQIAAKS
eukprot:COSAG06_NODE_53139_length_301_cov_2.168317_1_plen_32_part_10